MAPDEARVTVEVVYAEPVMQVVRELTLPRGSTLQDAVACAGIVPPGIDIADCKIGVFGKLHRLDTLVRDGDRVEIYRPLLADPKVARRTRARKNDPARGRDR